MRIVIEINWSVEAVRPIKIRYHHIKLQNKADSGSVKLGCGQIRDPQIAFEAQAQMIFDSIPRRSMN